MEKLRNTMRLGAVSSIAPGIIMLAFFVMLLGAETKTDHAPNLVGLKVRMNN